MKRVERECPVEVGLLIIGVILIFVIAAVIIGEIDQKNTRRKLGEITNKVPDQSRISSVLVIVSGRQASFRSIPLLAFLAQSKLVEDFEDQGDILIEIQYKDYIVYQVGSLDGHPVSEIVSSTLTAANLEILLRKGNLPVQRFRGFRLKVIDEVLEAIK